LPVEFNGFRFLMKNIPRGQLMQSQIALRLRSASDDGFSSPSEFFDSLKYYLESELHNRLSDLLISSKPEIDGITKEISELLGNYSSIKQIRKLAIRLI